MRIRSLPAALVAAALACGASAAQLPYETPLIVDGPVTVDAGDIEAAMLRVPEERRAEVRATQDRLAGMADGVFIARTLAGKARQEGLDKDPAVQRRLVQVQEALLADLYMQHVDKTAPRINLEPRARELYVAEPARFMKPEQVHVQHILVGLNGRTREMAAERARQLYEEARAGKEDFLALAARHSDDPDKKRNGGELGYNSPSAFVAPVAERIARMSKSGEISEPIESHMGFHIVRFVDRKKPELAKFEDVKGAIIAAEKDRLAKKRQEDIISAIRSSKTVTVHRDNVEKLVTPLPDVLPRAAAEAKPAR